MFFTPKRRAIIGAASLFIFGMGIGMKVKEAGAQLLPPQPAPITDYANYPANAQVAADCNVGDVHGIEYTVNGGTPLFDLAALPAIHAGDVLEVSWTDVAPQCNTPPNLQPITLAMKTSKTATFDPDTDQYLELPYAYDLMGPMGGRITYVLPNLGDDSYPGCFGQLDFVLGLPLAVVGPSGSFYGLNGEKNMLIDSWNGVYDLCVDQEVTTTTTEAPTTTTEAPTTTVAPTTTQPAPTTTVNETATSLQVEAAPATIVAPAGQIATQVAATRTVASMPVTGLNPIIAWVGVIAFCVGLGLLVGTIIAKRT